MRLCVFALVVSSLAASIPQIEVLETAPQESELDLRELRNAVDVFPELFARAESTIAVSQMYMLWYRPESRGALLFAFYDRLIGAARRGVMVRILLDSTTLEDNASPTYRRMRDSLNRTPGIEVRALDLRPYSRYPACMLHTKYMVIDGKTSVIGSHNWSFSAFADNRELSLLVEDSTIARQLGKVFETDWRVAGGGPGPAVAEGIPLPQSSGIAEGIPLLQAREEFGSGSRGRDSAPTNRGCGRGILSSILSLVVTSPEKLRDSTVLSTADALRRVFGTAKSDLAVEVNSLTTRADFGDSKHFLLLDSLLREAAGRGVRIRLLVDKWAYDLEPPLFRRLNNTDNIQVRIIDISELGPNPGTGSVHAKLVIADGQRALLGSATFSQRQIMECRNVGLLVEDQKTVGRLQAVFETDWNSHYVFKP